MFKIKFSTGTRWISGDVTYTTEAQAWHAVHEMLKETFGANYGKAELEMYRVVPVK